LVPFIQNYFEITFNVTFIITPRHGSLQARHVANRQLLVNKFQELFDYSQEFELNIIQLQSTVKPDMQLDYSQ